MKTDKQTIKAVKNLLKDGFHSKHHLKIELTKNLLPHIFEEKPKEESFLISKTQLLELKNGYKTEKLLEWFPSAFEDKKELVLEAGKWYSKDNLLCLIKCIDAPGRYFQRFHCYGFNTPTGYDNFCFDVNQGYPHGFELVAPEEVKSALEKEAVKRGYVGNFIKMIEGSTGNTSMMLMCDGFYFDDGRLMNYSGSGYTIFKDGIWAEIIKPKQMTQSDIEKELGYKIEIV